jgi:hypothetical protein
MKVVKKDSACCAITVSASGGITSFSGQSGLLKRYFLIGYIADSPDGAHIFDGGIDTSMDHYPNVVDLENWLHKKFNITKIRILSVTEQTKDQFDAFWKGYTDN